jgi:hypothetical protein
VLCKSLFAAYRSGTIRHKEQLEMLLPLVGNVILPQFLELLNLELPFVVLE